MAKQKDKGRTRVRPTKSALTDLAAKLAANEASLKDATEEVFRLRRNLEERFAERAAKQAQDNRTIGHSEGAVASNQPTNSYVDEKVEDGNRILRTAAKINGARRAIRNSHQTIDRLNALLRSENATLNNARMNHLSLLREFDAASQEQVIVD